MQFFSLDSEVRRCAAVEFMEKTPKAEFVLKPQREGGGISIFSDLKAIIFSFEMRL